MTANAVDLEYDLEEDSELVLNQTRVHLFFMERVEEAVVAACGGDGWGRFLDVGCGVGRQAVRMSQTGRESWALEPSQAMLRLAEQRVRSSGPGVVLVRGIAENLPFKDGSFESVLCKGSIDHFADSGAFVREIARILTPGGRAVIAVSNYDGLTCRVARRLAAARRSLGLPSPDGRLRYWEPPPTHTLRGNLHFVRGLGGESLEMEKCFGVSLLWPLPRWAWLVDRLPPALAHVALHGADRVARRAPALADVIVSTWRVKEAATPGAV